MPEIGVVTAILNQMGTYLPLPTFIKPNSKEIFRTGRSGQIKSADFFSNIALRFLVMNNWIAVT